MYAKHGNLVDADASGAKASAKHLETRSEVIPGHAFSDHWKADEGLHVMMLLYNNVGFRVGNFEGKVWASPFLRTSLSFGAPSLGNRCEYSHKPYISKNENRWSTFCRWQYRSIFVEIFLVGSVKRFFPQKCVSVLQGHPRSLIVRLSNSPL